MAKIELLYDYRIHATIAAAFLCVVLHFTLPYTKYSIHNAVRFYTHLQEPTGRINH